ncbi:unnamed protein product [Polarella glacialis]|uniref:Uncharacterized protein n=1 Tax=Polarella glacialis TaxID=89957 RepID=A0A813L9Z0_POLGL|nr:unnamed protein product [Polarella glacialis]
MHPMVRSTLGVLLVAAHVSVGFSEVRGDPACWSVGFDFETCCGKAFGPFGSPTCWDYFPREVAGYYSYQRCCGNDPVWSHQFRDIQVEPLPRRDARELVPRFDVKQIAQMVEYFLISLMRSDLRGQSETLQFIRQNILPTCKRLHLLSDFLYLARVDGTGFGVDVQSNSNNDNNINNTVQSFLFHSSWIQELQAADISGACFIAFYESDDELMEALTAIQDGGGSFIGPNLVATSTFQGLSDNARFLWVNSHAVAATHDTLAYEWGKSGSQLTGGKTFGKMSGGKQRIGNFESLCQLIDATRDVPGDFVELGVYKGFAARLAMEYMSRLAGEGWVGGNNNTNNIINTNINNNSNNNKSWRHSHFIDTWDGFSHEANSSWYFFIDGKRVMTFAETAAASVRQVRKVLWPLRGRYTIHIHDVLSGVLPPQIRQISAANIDVDSYEAVLAALRAVAPLLALGGIMRVDDAVISPSLAGATLAIDHFLIAAKRDGLRFTRLMSPTEYYLIRLQ